MTTTYDVAEMSIGQLLEHSLTEPKYDWSQDAKAYQLRYDAADYTAYAATLLHHGESLTQAWRFGILQTVDAYRSALRHGRMDIVAQIGRREPKLTGSSDLDAAIAALVELVTTQQALPTPDWVNEPQRIIEPSRMLFTNCHPALEQEAHETCPPAFRRHGVIVAANELSRI